MLRILLMCEVLCICATACAPDQTDPGAAELTAVAPSVSTPTPPAQGIDPCSGWPSGLFGAVASFQRGEDGTVSFHGGTWTVPIAATPGQVLSDVAFTVEAPTGTSGDPTSIRVGLYSNGNALAFLPLTPFGLGARVNGDIPLSGRIVASGEVLELEFTPLDAVNGGYAAHDTKIDAVQAFHPSRVRFVSALDSVVFSGSPHPNGADGIGMHSTNDQIMMVVDLADSDTLVGITGKVKVSTGGRLRMDVTAYDPDAFAGSGQQALLAEYDTVTTSGLNENMATTMSFRPTSTGPRFVSVLFRALSVGSAAAFVSGIEIVTN